MSRPEASLCRNDIPNGQIVSVVMAGNKRDTSPLGREAQC